MGILAIAYSDIDGLDGYSTDDVMIAKLVDMNGDKVPSKDDAIEMGRYPTSFSATAFGDWDIDGHTVTGIVFQDATYVVVRGASTRYYEWFANLDYGFYTEYGDTEPNSSFQDGLADGYADFITANPDSPSRPDDPTYLWDGDDPTDSGFIDVELNY